jgi:hypothetical protein
MKKKESHEEKRELKLSEISTKLEEMFSKLYWGRRVFWNSSINTAIEVSSMSETLRGTSSASA